MSCRQVLLHEYLLLSVGAAPSWRGANSYRRYLQGARQDVAIVRQAGSKRGPIIEDVLRLALRAPQLLLEGV
jgi:hypothetical protein